MIGCIDRKGAASTCFNTPTPPNPHCTCEPDQGPLPRRRSGLSLTELKGKITVNITQKRGFISWIGGKSRLANSIIPLMCEHTCYCEVFAGGAWLLFKKEPSQAEIINDINEELVTLYRVIKHHLEEFIRYFKYILIARDEFERFRDENPETLTDIQRAVRFYYIVKTCYGARVHKPTFGVSTSGHPRLNLLRIEEEMSAAHLSLQRVVIERLPYQEMITRYDRSHTLFYIDPPYYGCEDYYGNGIFSVEDFTTLRKLLANIDGKFIMSINDVPEIRELFRGFEIMEVSTKYSVGNAGQRQKSVKELLIANYPLKAV